MVEKPNTSPAKLLTADEALALGRRPEVLGYKRIERCIYRWVNHPSKTRIRRWQAEHRLYETLNNKQTNPDKKENGDK